MNWYPQWGLICICITLSIPRRSEGKTYGENLEKVEIELDLVRGNALVTYNDQWKATAKISYAQDKKIVAYKDGAGHCLWEKITKHKEVANEDGQLSSRVYRISQPLNKVQAEKLAGESLVSFCGKYPIILLKRYPVRRDDGKTMFIHGKNVNRAKRASDLMRGAESQLSHQEASKKHLEDLAVAEGLVTDGIISTKGVKRNADDGINHGRGSHPSASANVGQPATVDYHARIRNGLSSGVHPMHPIDITSSVTIATGASHPVWSYSPSAGSHYAQNATGSNHPGQEIPASHGVPHQSASTHQNTSQSLHHGQGHSPDMLPVYQGVTPLPSSSVQSFRTSSYFPPSSTSKSQSNIGNYPPSSASKTQASSHFPSSPFSKPQQNAAYYPPSSTSKIQHVPARFPPSSISKSHTGQGTYPPSSSSKTHYHSPALPQPSLAYYPPSSTTKTHNNVSTEGHGIYFGKAATASEFSQSSQTSPHGYHQSYIPPSSTSKIYYSAPQPQNTSHPSFHSGVIERGRGVYAPQFPPSSTSKVYHQQGQYGAAGREDVPQYAPSSTSKLHHLSHGGPKDHMHNPPQYPPSSTDRVPQPGSYYAPRYPPSSTSQLHHSPSASDLSYGQTPVLERPSARGGTQEPGSYPPSSTKVQYSAHSHVMPANVHGVQYYPPSSSSKVHYTPSSSGHDPSPGHPPPSQYPLSSTSKLHYPQTPTTPSGGPPAQIPQPPIDRNHLGSFPPSSTSKLHPSTSHHQQHYPPSASGQLPEKNPTQVQRHQPPAYYPPSATTKIHQTITGHHNFSKTKHPAPGYHSASSTSNLHHTPINHHDGQTGGSVTATGRVSVTPGFAYYPPSLPSKTPFIQQGQHISPGHPTQQRPYYGLSSPSLHHNVSVHAAAPFSVGHELYSPHQYPPSSTSKIHPLNQQNASVADHPKPFYPMEQHPSSSGQQYPAHRNDSSSGQVSHPSQGPHYLPRGHHPPTGGGYVPQYPPSSSSPHQGPFGSSPTQFYQGTQTSGQGSPAAARPCQSSARSLYSITTRTILTPNGAIQRPVSVKNNGDTPCGQLPGPVSFARYAPCSGTLMRNGQTFNSQTQCTANGNLRKSMRNDVPGLAVLSENSPPHQGIRNDPIAYSNPNALNSIQTQTELLHDQIHPISHHRSHFSKLQAGTPENYTSNGERDDPTAPEYFEENVRNSKDVEVFEGNEAESRKMGNPVKYQENKEENKEQVKVGSEEEVKEGDVLEPGDRILGKDGYTISDGFRGRVVSVTGQIGKKRAETGKETRPTSPQQETEKKSNSGQFKYSSDLGRYVKEDGEKSYSNCHGEPTFTCSEFLGSNGRAKICKPNPRRNPDGSPC